MENSKRPYYGHFFLHLNKTGYGRVVISIVQWILSIFARVLMPIFWARLKVFHTETKIEDGVPILIITNHKSYYDPIVVDLALRKARFKFPIRYFSKDQLFYSKIGSWFYSLSGAFPAFYKQGLEKSLEVPKHILENKGTVLIFPEGRCVRDDSLGEGKVGAAYLALKAKNLVVVPMAIHSSYRIKWRMFFGLPEVRVRLGKPYRFEEKIDSTDLGEVTRIFMSQIEDLFKSIKE